MSLFSGVFTEPEAHVDGWYSGIRPGLGHFQPAVLSGERHPFLQASAADAGLKAWGKEQELNFFLSSFFKNFFLFF